MKRRSRKAGLPPGSLVHIGEQSTEPILITIYNYTEGDFSEKQITAEECRKYKNIPGVTWINVDGVHQPEIVKTIGEIFGLHPLVMEDILNTDQRPKIEDQEDYLYIVLKMLHYSHTRKEIVTEQVSFILGKNFVISFQEKEEGDAFNPVRDRLRSGKGSIRKMGADYLAYSLLDGVIDHYFAIMEILGEKVEDLEARLLMKPSPEVLAEVHALKRELIYLRKSVWPLREMIAILCRGESPLIKAETLPYLRDIYDHTVQSMDAIETLRDILTEMLDIYLSSMSNKMNEVMKVLTVIGTIFMPLTFVVGIYGMNFDFMPELHQKWAYPAIMTGMGALALGMLAFFKRKKWF